MSGHTSIRIQFAVRLPNAPTFGAWEGRFFRSPGTFEGCWGTVYSKRKEAEAVAKQIGGTVVECHRRVYSQLRGKPQLTAPVPQG